MDCHVALQGHAAQKLCATQAIRTLRNYSRPYVKLQWSATRVLHELVKQLEMCNIRIASCFSHADSLSVLRVIRLLIAGCSDTAHLLACVSPVVLKRKGHLIRAALEGNITQDSRFILQLQLQQYDLPHQQLTQTEGMMRTICTQYYQQELQLLQTIPGIKEQSAMQIIAETGGDMHAFETGSKMVGWPQAAKR